MVALFSLTKTRIYRNLKYRIRRPSPPIANIPLNGPVLIVGSAPVSHLPADFDDSYRVITINGSQTVTGKWGIEVPDITFMQFNQISGTNTNAVEVRRVLNGQRTKMLYVLLWREGLPKLVEGLQAFNYRYDKLQMVDRYERMALLDRICNFKSLELDAEGKCSNGINAVLFALYNKAPAVIITGINPKSSGHVYNKENLSRMHTDMDQKVLQRLLEKGYPIYTADPPVSDALGIPLWQGKRT